MRGGVVIRSIKSTRRAAQFAFGAALLAFLALAFAGVARADGSATDAVRQFLDPALQIMADKQAPVARRQQQLRQLIEPKFDFTEMSRSALGYHWKTLTPDQRGNFTQVFTSFIESAYLNKIGDYSGQKVEFVSESAIGDGYKQVSTRIVQAGKDPIPVNYLLEAKDGGQKVYDVTVDNISIIANYRTQFNRVMNDQGFDKLLADLKAKQQQLDSPSTAG
jgi:phospholipid transport system substrate-binding protein